MAMKQVGEEELALEAETIYAGIEPNMASGQILGRVKTRQTRLVLP